MSGVSEEVIDNAELGNDNFAVETFSQLPTHFDAATTPDDF